MVMKGRHSNIVKHRAAGPVNCRSTYKKLLWDNTLNNTPFTTAISAVPALCATTYR